MTPTAETPETIAELRERLKDWKEANGASWAKLARMVGVPEGTLTPWAGGQYAGDNARVALEVRKFLDADSRRAELTARLIRDPGFIETPSALRFLHLFGWAHTGEIVAISAPPGTGKTLAARAYQARASNVWLATARPSASGLQPFQLAVCQAMGFDESRSNPQALTARIVGRMRSARGLLIIDEAQELSDRALDEVRSWHDETGCGIAFVGYERVVGRLGGVRAKLLARLHSRISMRHVQYRPTDEDAAMIARAWGLADGALIARMQKLAAKPGGLRGVAKVIKLAGIVATDAGRPITVSDLDDAWRQLGYDLMPAAEGGAR
ncbi:AAA family ATPase [Thermaurantiacus tibetensis]|uniref:AAA family ATPase n=1 Tax=Thermaurantiacus tibetensis TaxID=2759035 RepID=UPI00188FB187|nr:AAA family ATPase [Thermaurantiacus tibetensis]